MKTTAAKKLSPTSRPMAQRAAAERPSVAKCASPHTRVQAAPHDTQKVAPRATEQVSTSGIKDEAGVY